MTPDLHCATVFYMPISVVTGATDGIGFETARQLVALGHRVLVHGRSESAATQAAFRIRGRAEPVWGDFSNLSEVRALAEQIKTLAPKIDVLVNNAGIYMHSRLLTADGHEATFQVNYLAPFLLTELLREPLLSAGKARIINVSSAIHSSGSLSLDDMTLSQSFTGYKAYTRSKLALVMHVHALARRWAGLPVTANALHPGVISTKMLKLAFGMTGAPVEIGAQTSIYCATAPELDNVTGCYFSKSRAEPCADNANSPSEEDALFTASGRAVNLKF